MERNVIIKNMIDAKVGVKDISTGLNRVWQRRGQVMGIPFEIVEQLLWQDGFRNMIDQGILYIENMKDKQDLGLESADATVPENIIVLTDKEIEYLLKEAKIDEFKKRLTEIPDTQIDLLIDYAINHKIVDSVKCTILKKITQRDILKAISNQETIDAIDKAAKEGAKKKMDEGRR